MAGVTQTQTEQQALGERVRAARRRLPYVDGNAVSQSELGKRAGIGQRTISLIENGKQASLSIDQFHALARELSEDPYYLFTGKRANGLSDFLGQLAPLEADLDDFGKDAVLLTAHHEAERSRADRERMKDELRAEIEAEVRAELLSSLIPESMYAAARSLGPEHERELRESIERLAHTERASGEEGGEGESQ